MTEEPEAEEEKEIEEISDRENFDQEKLDKVCEEYRAQRKAEGASDMELIILNKPLELLENFQLQLVLSNTLELNILERAEAGLVQHLRKTLSNGQIKLKTEITEVEEKDKLYTDRDKFEFMVQKNPDLQKLKDRLGLDFEF